jgi:hypothetical protein
MFGLVSKWISDRTLRQNLISQMRSSDNAMALNAVSELLIRNWTDLKGEDFSLANLQGAYLSEFNFQNCDLSSANLRNTLMAGTDLRGAYLVQADLTDAILQIEPREWTIYDLMEGFKIWDEARLRKQLARKGDTPENLLQGLSQLQCVQMDFETILPDGGRYVAGKDLGYYTEKDYPGGKFKPWSGEKAYRLAVHGLLNTPIAAEYE